VRVTVGISGTGGGFKKFAAGEIDIADASRPIKPEEAQTMAAASIEFIELPIAYDGLSVVVNPENKFVDHLSVEELHAIWAPESQVKLWSDVRASWPKEPLTLYGPGHDSGTFDYFTEVINGKAQACRSDYTASEDDNVLVQGVSGDKGSLGFFGYAYYVENQDKLRAVPIVTSAGPVAPSPETIRGGTYVPLSRPVFIYVSVAAAERADVQSFVNFFLDQSTTLVPQVGYIPLPESVLTEAKERFAGRAKGTMYGPESKGKTLEQIYSTPS
jgi:phosphate transport system substrate-binding protein